MSNILDAAKTFFDQAKNMAGDVLRDAVKLLSEDVRNAYYKMHKDSYFIPENEEVKCRADYSSPSGKYKLSLSNFKTGKNSWSYSQGKVFSVGSDEPIAVIR